MKAPLFNQIEREIIINHPKSHVANRYNFHLAQKKFVREFSKALYIPEIVDWLSKQLNKFNSNEK